MTIEQLKEEVIKRGLESVEQYEKREYRKQGCIEGFEMTRNFNTPFEFEEVLKERRTWQIKMSRDVDYETYWRYAMATEQIDWVYKVLQVAWRYPELSGRAMMLYAQIVGVKPTN